MVISACEESDGTEESGRDCCTITCASKGTCLQTPSSLNPASPSCTQHHLHHAAQLLPEEARRLHASASSTASTSAPPVQTQQQENSPDSSDEHEALTPSSPSPSPAPLSHPHQYGASSTEQLEINNDCGAAQCSPPDSTTMAAISTVPSPSSSPASSSSDLHLRSPLSLLPSPTPPSTSSPAIDTGDTHSRPPIFRHSPREQKGAALNKKHPGSSAASLDPNAREFIPIAAPSSSLVLRFHQSQASSEADMAALHRHMGALNLDAAGTAEAPVVGYEPLHQPNREMGTTFYSTACPTHADVGYHSPCTGEVRFHNSQEGAYESHGYGATLYQAAWQISYPVTPGQEGLARPEPAPLHNHVGLPSLSPAMVPSHAPQLVAATAMAVPPSLPSPSLYPTAGAMEAQIMSTLHSQKQFPPYQGPHANGSKEHVSRTLLISGLPPYISEAQLREELECWGAVRGIQADAHPQGLQVMVQFFDLRAARQALRDLQNMYIAHHHHQPQEAVFASHGRTGVLCGNVVSAQYITSWGMAVPDAHNQGTLVLFNVGADVNTQDVRRTFEVYGNVREVREAPTKRQHKFVEFYDVRAAAAAWSALNGKEICGKCVKIEFSRQGGAMARRQKANQDKAHQEMIAGMGTNGAGMHGPLMNPCSWNGNTPTYGLSVYNAGLQPQGWEHWPSHETVPPHFPVNLYVAGGPHGLTIPVYPEAGAHGDSNGKIGEKDVTPSGARRVQHMQLHCGGGTGAKERIAGVSRIPKGHTHYQFDEDEMYSHPSNPRTTLMVQNIPNKYSQKMLLTMLDQHCLQFNSNLGAGEPEAAYDFMYLPIDFKNKCNLGYAFVNFTSPQATLAFYKTFHGKAWEEFNSRKICGVAFARLQGRPALEEHFKNSRFACDTEEYLPVLFVPPRNGCNQSQPRVAVGQGAGAVRGVRSGNGGRSYFSNDPCNQHERAMSDTSSSSSPSTLSSVCEAEAKGVAQTSEPQDLAHPDMG